MVTIGFTRPEPLATRGDYGVIASRSGAFGDGFLGVAALWIILGKRGQKKRGLSFQSPEGCGPGAGGGPAARAIEVRARQALTPPPRRAPSGIATRRDLLLTLFGRQLLQQRLRVIEIARVEPLGEVRREIYGRWGSYLLRLPPSA